MKKYFLFLLIIIDLLIPIKAYAIENGTENIDYYIRKYESESKKVESISISDIFDLIVNSLQDKWQTPLKIFLKLSAVIFLYSSISSLYSTDVNVNLIYENVCTLIIFLNLLIPIKEIVLLISDNLYSVKNFIISFLPVYAGISLASGEIFSSTIYTGFMLSVMVLISDICLYYLIPSFRLYFALIISDSLSPYIRLGSISDLYSKLVRWVLRISVSLLCFILTLQSTISHSRDSIAVKTGKLIAGSAIPVIGSTLQDAVSSVYASMETIKNFAGITGIITVVGICLPTIIMLIMYWFQTNILLVISDLFDARAIKKCIAGFMEIIQLMISVVTIYILMFVFSLTILIVVTNGV